MTRVFRTRRNADASTEPGHDSFLDVVANLVGILIILVVLIGTQAQSVWQKDRAQSEQVEESQLPDLQASVENAEVEASRLTKENAQIEELITQQKSAVVDITRNRDRLQLAVAAIEQTIEQREKDFSEAEKKQQALKNEGEKLRSELQQLQLAESQFSPVPSTLGVIDHLPTPIAKTVFGEEIHFRLKAGRVVTVPMDELVDLMRSEWKVKAKKLMQTPATIETVGPVNNFRLQYKLVLKQQQKRTEHGVVTATVPGLERFVLLPTSDLLGEPYEKAIQPGSVFMETLQRLNPAEVTISVWVYPDSFELFNKMKHLLYERGFLCAGWPLPENQPISGSPNGFRTAAQ